MQAVIILIILVLIIIGFNQAFHYGYERGYVDGVCGLQNTIDQALLDIKKDAEEKAHAAKETTNRD